MLGLASSLVSVAAGGGRGPALVLPYARRLALDPRETFTRSSTAWDFNAAGALESNASGAPRFDFDPVTKASLGLRIEESRTNKCTNFNANPTDLTSVAKSGDAAATLTVVDDSAALAAAGLSGVCTSGKVYKLDNSAGTTNASASVSGGVGNTNAHTLSAYWRGSGQARINTSGVAASLTGVPAAYQRQKVTITPLGTTEIWTLVAAAGAVVFFTLNQLEEGAFATTPIVVAGASATRAADSDSIALSAVGIPANPSALTIIGKARTAIGPDSTNAQYLFQIDDGSGTNRIFVRRLATSGNITIGSSGGGVQDGAATIYTAAPNDNDFAFWFAIAPNDIAAQITGQTKQTDLTVTMPTGLTTLRAGHADTTATRWNSTIAELQIFNRRLSDAEAAARAAAL